MEIPGLSEEKFCRYLETILNVPIVKVNQNGNVLIKYAEIHESTCPDFSKEEITNAIDLKIGIMKRDDDSLYGTVTDLDLNVFLIGPLRPMENERKLTQNRSYYCLFTTIIKTMLMLYEYLTGIEVSFIEFFQMGENAKYRRIIEEHRTRYHFNQQENGWIHNSYMQEKREQNAIREGDIKKLESALSEPVIGKLGVSSKNRIRSVKNNCLTVIVLSVRSAIEGGLDSEEAFRLSDIFMAQVENQNDIEQLVRITRNAEFELTELVARRKKEKSAKISPYIDKCKKYIYKHLHERISVADMADEMGLTESYLSNVFRQEENITITDYIMQLKIYYAQNLLTYSEYNYDEIAYYFGFSSRSHFGSVFKKITGLTPKQYRDQYRIKEFFKES
ncbi:helix-turn-helix domain-containing protein [Clostridium sp. AF19-22AC]|jgi:YesN/AraC family two-component response regulator|uniref:helix-turn-helix domain-containing protein n=1 Tax=Clostridia TaxID=186801 RepID=UPI000E506CB2|nr:MULTISPECIES: helix-turn-helix domain-containing protein [Clostridia]RHR26210.1 helix-turn-helix domain-containing protein [Clostridium sp. AF19-22AC]